ncbi:MAG: AAA family ATPase, partial [Proteobacteria bacterium]|nr:AAA family ATPase [Pseudomonadota bacterium]
PGQAFCHGCGRHLGERTTLAPERDPRAYTPKHLADKILQSKSALEGERKQVTVLFADVKGSMELAEQIDPEEWHGILDRFFSILAEGVHRFEGTVNQYTGDGIMALFGAPIAHEDHAQRACYAALWLRDELRRHADDLRLERGLNMSVRIGLNSGEVVVGKIGDDLRMDYTAQGHTVGLAARMEALAESGRIYLTEHTARSVLGYFTLRDLGPTRVKGQSEPLSVHELEGLGALRTRFDASRARGLTRFVGREDDMHTLEAALARTREGNGQVVGVVADAGTGKSRLCFEFVELCRARGLSVLEGQAVAHGRNIPLLPILQVFRAYYGIEERDSPRTVREKIAGRMLLIEEEYRATLPLLFEFFGVPDPERPAAAAEPDTRQRQLFAVLRRLGRQDQDEEPRVTLIEDLHWIDAASEAFLEQMVEAVAGTRRLLVVNFRPEYHAAWMQKSHYHQLPLAPLGPEAIRDLLDDLLGDDPSLAGLADAIHGRTQGNPFFTEEIVQTLIEAEQLEGARGAYRLVTAVERLEVPDSVSAVLAARIDRLHEREKQVLQTAAVIGKEFPRPILEAVAELPARDLSEALGARERAEFVHEESLYPVEEYAFKHPLTQEVALGSLLHERRARIHAGVAREIEARDQDRLDERAALLAHHWEGAGEPLLAAGWHRRAAEWTSKTDAGEALRHLRTTVALLEGVPDGEERRQHELGAQLRILGQAWKLGLEEDEVTGAFERGRAIAESAGDLEARALLHALYAMWLGFNASDLPGCIREAREALRLADDSGSAELLVCVAPACLIFLWWEGATAEAIELYRRIVSAPPANVAHGSEIYGWAPYAFAMGLGRNLEAWGGRLGGCLADLERVLRMVREQGSVELQSYVHFWSNLFADLLGESEAAMAHARQAVELAENFRAPLGRVYAYYSLGIAQGMAGRWKEAVEAQRNALEIARREGAALGEESTFLGRLAQALAACGDTAAGRECAEEAMRASNMPWTEMNAQLAVARVELRSGEGADPERIRGALDRLEILATRHGVRALLPIMQLERAELARLQNDETGRLAALGAARGLFEEMGADRRVAEVDALLGVGVEA